MSRYLIGVFTAEQDLLAATQQCRDAGLPIHDVYTPYAVHGLERAMGLGRSRLTWVCFIAAMCAAAFALWFQVWTSSVDWPIVIGGKDPNSLPAFIPVTFELAILVGGLTTVAALLIRSRLYPGRAARLPVPGVTDDRFALVLLQRDSSFDTGRARALLNEHGAAEILDVGGNHEG